MGQNPDSSLRYESWGDTVQLGFTQLRVADYLFTPSALSPTWPTHVAYVWDSVTYTMKMYVNGYLAGATAAVDPNFVMPTGAVLARLQSRGRRSDGGRHLPRHRL